MKTATLRPRAPWGRIVIYGVLIFFAALALLPLLFMVLTSWRPDEDYAAGAARWPAGWRWENFPDAWARGQIGMLGLNSVIITAGSVLACLLFGAMAAYAVTKVLKPRPAGAVYSVMVIGLIIPIQVLMIPLFKVLQQFALINTFHGIILIYVALNMAFAVFVFAGFMRTIPAEILEAARIDGAGILTIFGRIILPMSRTPMATVAILTGMSVWKDMTVPLVYITNPHLKTLPIGLFYFKNDYSFSVPVLMADMVIQTLPLVVLFVVLQKTFVKGITDGAVKG